MFALITVDFHNQRRPAALLQVTADKIERVMELPFGLQLVMLDDGSYIGVEAATGVETQIHLHRYKDKIGWDSKIIYRDQPAQQASARLVTNGRSIGVVVDLTKADSSVSYYLHPAVKTAL